MINTFWDTYKQVLVIVLGLVVQNTFVGFLEDGRRPGLFVTVFAFDTKSFIMLTTFLLILFRFGFTNILFADELSRKGRPESKSKKFYQFFSFVVMTFSAVLLGIMSYYVNLEKYGATMYFWFVILCFVDCLWDIISWLIDKKEGFRVVWFWNKLGYITVISILYAVFHDNFDPFQGRSSILEEHRVLWDKFFLILIIITWASSFLSLCIGRKMFFPFLFEADENPPPPLTPS